jgi:fatty acid desaturase
MTDDNKPANRDGQRRVSGFRAVVAIVLGIAFAIRYSNNGGEAWSFWLLFWACFGLAAYFVFDALRS